MSEQTNTEREAAEEDAGPGRPTSSARPRTSRAPADAEREPLFEAADRDRFGESWTSIQAAFVDDPREAVKEADSSSPS